MTLILLSQNQMTCIYAKSKYYNTAKLEPLDIVRPLGFEQKKKQPARQINSKLMSNRIPLIVTRILSDHSHSKQISSKIAPLNGLDKTIKFQPAVQRKNYCLSGVNLQFASHLDPQVVQKLRDCYMPGIPQKTDIFQHLQQIMVLNLIKESIHTLRDYAISTYFVVYQGNDKLFYEYLSAYLSQTMIEYQSEILFNSPYLGRPTLRTIFRDKKELVEEYINDILHRGEYKDKMFNGIHLYICNVLPRVKMHLGSILQEEVEYWEHLLFQVTVVTGTLGNGGNAILKIGGCYTQKTIEFLYLLRLCFSKMYFFKWMGSNAFTSQRHIVCESFNEQAGRQLSRFLLSNYDKINKQRDQIAIVPVKYLFQNEFYSNINDYNNSMPIFKIAKDTFRLMEGNNTVRFYPYGEAMYEVLEKSAFPMPFLEEIRGDILKMIPDRENQDFDKTPIITEKKAEAFDFEAMSKLAHPGKSKKKEDTSHLFDLKDEFPESNFNYLQAVGQVKVQRIKERAQKRHESAKKAK